MSRAEDRRLVVAAFTKRAAAETPLTSVTPVPGGPAPAVAGKKPIGKGKKISAVPSIKTSAINTDLLSAINKHLEKAGAGGWIPKKPHEPYDKPWVPPKPHEPYNAAQGGQQPGLPVGKPWVPPKPHEPYNAAKIPGQQVPTPAPLPAPQPGMIPNKAASMVAGALMKSAISRDDIGMMLSGSGSQAEADLRRAKLGEILAAVLGGAGILGAGYLGYKGLRGAGNLAYRGVEGLGQAIGKKIGTPQKEKKEKKKDEGEEKESALIDMLNKASACSAMKKMKMKGKKKMAADMTAGSMPLEADQKAKSISPKKKKLNVKMTNVSKAAADGEAKGEFKPLAADQPVKKAPEKKPEKKESENEVKKAALPDAPSPMTPPAPPAGPGTAQPPAPGGGINMDEILSQLGSGLQTIGSKSMGGVGSALGALGMPGAQEQLNMWSQDPTVSKGVGGGVSALGAILIAYLLRRLMSGGGGGGMELSASQQCQDLIKAAGDPILNPKMNAAMDEAKQTMSGLSGYQNPAGNIDQSAGLSSAGVANAMDPKLRAAGQTLNRAQPHLDKLIQQAPAQPSPGSVAPAPMPKAQQQGVQRAQSVMGQ